jgi:hypothetical protein
LKPVNGLLSYFPDDQSRQVVRELLMQVGFGTAIMIATFAVGLQTGPQIGAAAVRVFTFYSVIDFCRACCRRERMGGPSFNHWDQAAACNLIAIGIDLILKW